MDDDVVRRLMAFAEGDGVLWDAVHEIERLREQLRALEAERDQWIKQAIGHG